MVNRHRRSLIFLVAAIVCLLASCGWNPFRRRSYSAPSIVLSVKHRQYLTGRRWQRATPNQYGRADCGPVTIKFTEHTVGPPKHKITVRGSVSVAEVQEARFGSRRNLRGYTSMSSRKPSLCANQYWYWQVRHSTQVESGIVKRWQSNGYVTVGTYEVRYEGNAYRPRGPFTDTKKPKSGEMHEFGQPR